jgi:hypothetical protein
MENQPNSRMCFVCGVDKNDLGPCETRSFLEDRQPWLSKDRSKAYLPSSMGKLRRRICLSLTLTMTPFSSISSYSVTTSRR